MSTTTYDVVGNWKYMGAATRRDFLNVSTLDQLEKWAADPNCNQQAECTSVIGQRQEQLRARAERLALNPFDSRTEVSADARRIVLNMWIIMVVLPFVVGIVIAVMK
jgi:hypothetical protein